MKAVIQRVKKAKVIVDGREVSQIGPGILTLLGVGIGDTENNLIKLLNKIIELRIFADSGGKMNLSLREMGGEHLLVSQFTLQGDLEKGRRPSFHLAEKPERANELYQKALILSQDMGVPTCGGLFGENMQIELVNDGPVTFILESVP